MRRIIVATLAMALCGGGIAVAQERDAAPEASPTASKVPTIKVGQARARAVATPYSLRLIVRKPVLKGSTAKNRRAFSKAFAKAVRAERASLGTRQTSRCGAQGTATLEVRRVDADVYERRYASMTIHFRSRTGCESGDRHSVRSYTLDLARGKPAKLSKFAAINDLTTQLVTISRLTSAHGHCVSVDDLRPRGTQSHPYAWPESSQPLPRHSGWSVGKSGLRLTFAHVSGVLAQCGVVTVVVPWKQVAAPKQLRGKKRHEVFVYGLGYDRGSLVSGEVAIVTTQGRKVTVGSAAIEAEVFGCAFGVRRGSKARMFAEVSASPWTLKFASSSSGARARIPDPFRRATRAELKSLRQYTSESGYGKLDAANYCFS